ncbi:hypothetical protein [Marinobacter alexandrii]|uniref:hypothetical protein n=1 Tax=Marinobacter alexandrii TaxID=2570351 RepID=UPI003267572D
MPKAPGCWVVMAEIARAVCVRLKWASIHLGLLATPAVAVAEPSLTLGADYSYSDYTVQGTERDVVLTPQGPGLSVTVAGDGPWSASLSHSQQDDRERVSSRFDLDYEVDSVGVQLSGSWLVGDYSRWVSLFWQRDQEELKIIDRADATSNRLNYRERIETDGIGVEVGQAWEWPQWSPSLALSVNALRSEVDRQFQSMQQENNLLIAFEEDQDLDGVDASLSAGIDYFHSVDLSTLLIPSAILTYQRSLSGEITSGSRSALVHRRGIRISSSSTGPQSLDAEDQVTLDLSVNLLMGDWQGLLGYSRPLLEKPYDERWIGGVSYRF